MKWKVLKNARNLKHTRKEWTKKVAVVKDMTQKERREPKILYEKLLEKRNSGELGWHIRDGKLMRGKQCAA